MRFFFRTQYKSKLAELSKLGLPNIDLLFFIVTDVARIKLPKDHAFIFIFIFTLHCIRSLRLKDGIREIKRKTIKKGYF